MWKCADPELEHQIRCFPYGEHSDVPRLQQVDQKAIGRQRNLGLMCKMTKFYVHLFPIWFLTSFHCLRFNGALKIINVPKMCHN